jgi:hypothetical protein
MGFFNDIPIFGDIFKLPSQIISGITGIGHDIASTPSNIAKVAGSTITGVVGTAGNTVSNLGNDFTKVLSSPMVLIGGAVVLMFLLNK